MTIVAFFLLGFLVVKLPLAGGFLLLALLALRWTMSRRGAAYFRLRGR